MHSAMADVSKAFDPINQNVSLDGLVQTSLPEQVKNTKGYIQYITAVTVVFNNIETESCRVGNGSRQGMFSPCCIFAFTSIKLKRSSHK